MTSQNEQIVKKEKRYCFQLIHGANGRRSSVVPMTPADMVKFLKDDLSGMDDLYVLFLFALDDISEAAGDAKMTIDDVFMTIPAFNKRSFIATFGNVADVAEDKENG